MLRGWLRATKNKLRPYWDPDPAELQLRRALKQGHPPILVYQMGKVGSRSVFESLQAAGIPNPVYHIHNLTEDQLAWIEARYRARNVEPNLEHIAHSRLILPWWNRPDRQRWKIITMVRDPIRALLSGLFHNPEIHNPHLLNARGEIDHGVAEQFAAEALTQTEGSLPYIVNWFEREFQLTTGLDVYQHPFDQNSGFAMITGQRDDVLILRLEDLSKNFSMATEKFLPIVGRIPLLPANVNEGKQHSPAYEELMKTLRLPKDALERVYNTRYARHFYSAEEREQSIARWSGEG